MSNPFDFLFKRNSYTRESHYCFIYVTMMMFSSEGKHKTFVLRARTHTRSVCAPIYKMPTNVYGIPRTKRIGK